MTYKKTKSHHFPRTFTIQWVRTRIQIVIFVIGWNGIIINYEFGLLVGQSWKGLK
jgi:hypothetical protein